MSVTRTTWDTSSTCDVPRAQEDHRPHGITLHCVTILVPRSDGNPITRFADITKTVSADLKLRLIVRSVPMGRTLDQSKLSSICGEGAVNIHRQSDCQGVNSRNLFGVTLRALEKLMLLMPVYVGIDADQTRRLRL